MVQNSLSNKKCPFDGKEAVSEKSTMQHVWTQVGITLAYLALVGFIFAMLYVTNVLDTLVLSLTTNAYAVGFCLILFAIVMEVLSSVGRIVSHWAGREKYTWITIEALSLIIIILGGLIIAGMFFMRMVDIFGQIGGHAPDFPTILIWFLVLLVFACCLISSAIKWVNFIAG